MNRGQLRDRFLNTTSVKVAFEDVSDTDFAAVVHSLPTLPDLEELALTGTKVGDEGIAALADAAKEQGLPLLQSLHLRGTPVGDEGIAALADAAKKQGLPLLQSLYLHDTHVGDEGIAALADAAKEKGLPQLQTLNLSRTQVETTSKPTGAR